MIFFADFLNSGIRLTTPILFAAIASMLSARAGVLNPAIGSRSRGSRPRARASTQSLRTGSGS